ncbi:MAG: RAMP superfamily CRISPR-associated protein [Anaerolineae bacterium]
MTTMRLSFTLESDATFGRGEGVPGLVDEEVEHDRYGQPFLRGRTLKGLLVEECANILHALQLQRRTDYALWEAAAAWLFGSPGSVSHKTAAMRVGNARLPADLRHTVMHYSRQTGNGTRPLTRLDVLESLTAIRRQTAMDETTGRPEEGSLRGMRVILRRTPFEARLQFSRPPIPEALPLLSACVLAFRRAGTGRNRGRGHLSASLLDADGNDVTATYFEQFKTEVNA